MFVCNARSLANNLTGVPRYILELTARFGDQVQLVKPHKRLSGARGHLWEQCVLPVLTGRRLLWSPGISGPIAVEKQVVSIHDVVPLDHPEWLQPKFAAWYQFMTPRLVRKVRRILVPSEFTRQRLIHHCPTADSKTTIVQLATDRRFAPVGEEGIARAVSILAIPSKRYLVVLGSLEPRKNLRRLLQAWGRIATRVPEDIWLVVAGSKGNKIVFGDVGFDRLPARVYFSGHVPDDLLPALYSGAMASVYVSLYEGFGFPPLEAMACGTPVLSSGVASLPEVVGEAAMLIDPVNVDEIADGLQRILEDADLRRQLRSAGLAQAQRFSWDRVAAETWKVLQAAS